MSDDTDNPVGDFLEDVPELPAGIDPEHHRKLVANLQKHRNDRQDPKYNVLNAAVWHAYTGHLSNRITDVEAYLEPMSELLDSLKETARKSDNAMELINILEKVEAYKLDVFRYLQELRNLSVKMEAELEWYQNELFAGMFDAEPGTPDDDDPG